MEVILSIIHIAGFLKQAGCKRNYLVFVSLVERLKDAKTKDISYKLHGDRSHVQVMDAKSNTNSFAVSVLDKQTKDQLFVPRKKISYSKFAIYVMINMI